MNNNLRRNVLRLVLNNFKIKILKIIKTDLFCFGTRKIDLTLTLFNKKRVTFMSEIFGILYNFFYTGKSLSEGLIFAEHGENMLCT